MRNNKQLDEVIRRNVRLDDMTKKIAVHAVRTATNITYRDVLLLRDAMGANKFLGNRKSLHFTVFHRGKIISFISSLFF